MLEALALALDAESTSHAESSSAAPQLRSFAAPQLRSCFRLSAKFQGSDAEAEACVPCLCQVDEI